MSGGCLQPSTLSTKTRCGKGRATQSVVHAFHIVREAEMTKQDLRSYQHIKTEITQIEGQIRELSSRMYSPRTPHLTGLPSAASTERGSAQERAATELFALRDHYERKIRELSERQLRIERAIETLDDPMMRTLLRYHYIEIVEEDRAAHELLSRSHLEKTRTGAFAAERCQFMTVYKCYTVIVGCGSDMGHPLSYRDRAWTGAVPSRFGYGKRLRKNIL